MCLLAVLFRSIPAAPLLLAANREEFYSRPALPPAIQPGPPRVLCGTDQRAGGTWLGVNQFGLVVAVTNRRNENLPPDPRSRGTLCRELLELSTAVEAARRAEQELSSGRYAGANYVCVDSGQAFVVHGGDQVEARALQPGLHLLTNGEVDDERDPRQALARSLFESAAIATAADFVRVAKRVCSTRASGPGEPTIVLDFGDRGTVSSSIIALPRDRREAAYWHAPRPPHETSYNDYSAELCSVLAAGAA